MTRGASVLFVCTGNTCRSPFAAAVTRRLGVDAASVGIEAGYGAPASPGAIDASSRRGIDLSGHLSRPIAAADVAAAGIVLVMTEAHAEELRRRWPDHAAKVERLDDGDIDDPWGGSIAEYDAVMGRIEAAVARRFGDA